MAESERRQPSIININEEYGEGEIKNKLINENIGSNANENKIENSYPEVIEKIVPEAERKIEETLINQKVIKKKKPKKKGFNFPSTSDEQKKAEPKQNLSSPSKKIAPKIDSTNQQQKQQIPKPEITNVPVDSFSQEKKAEIQSKTIIKDPLTQSVPKKIKKKKNIDPLSSLSASSTVTRNSNAQPIRQKSINDPLSILGGTDLQNSRKTIAAPTNSSSKITIEKPKPEVKNLFEEDEENNNVELFKKTHNKATSSITFSNPSQNINKPKKVNIFEEEDDRLSLRISAVPENFNNQSNMKGSNINNSGTNPFQPPQNKKAKNKLQFLFEEDN